MDINLEKYKNFVNDHLKRITSKNCLDDNITGIDAIYYKEFYYEVIKKDCVGLMNYYIDILKSNRMSLNENMRNNEQNEIDDNESCIETVVCGSVYNALGYISSILLLNSDFDVDKKEYKEILEKILELLFEDLNVASINDLKNTLDDSDDYSIEYVVTLNVVCFLYTNYLYYANNEQFRLDQNPVSCYIKSLNIGKLRDVKAALKSVISVDAYLILNELLRIINYEYEVIDIHTKKIMHAVEYLVSVDILNTYYLSDTHFPMSQYLPILLNSFKPNDKIFLSDETLFSLVLAIQTKTDLINYFVNTSKYGNKEDLQMLYNLILLMYGNIDVEQLILPDIPQLPTLKNVIEIENDEITKRVVCYSFLHESEKLRKTKNINDMRAKITQIIEKVMLEDSMKNYLKVIISSIYLEKYKTDILTNINDYPAATKLLRKILKKSTFNEINSNCIDLIQFYMYLIRSHRIHEKFLNICSMKEYEKHDNQIEFLIAVYEGLCLIGSVLIVDKNYGFIKKAYVDCACFYLSELAFDVLYENVEHVKHSFRNRNALSLQIVCYIYNVSLLYIDVYTSSQFYYYSRNFPIDIFKCIIKRLSLNKEVDAYLIFRDFLASSYLNVFSSKHDNSDIEYDLNTTLINQIEKYSSDEVLMNYHFLCNTHFLAANYLTILKKALNYDRHRNKLLMIISKRIEVVESFKELMKNGTEMDFEKLFDLIAEIGNYSGRSETVAKANKREICEKFFSKVDKSSSIEDFVKEVEKLFDNYEKTKQVSVRPFKLKLCPIL